VNRLLVNKLSKPPMYHTYGMEWGSTLQLMNVFPICPTKFQTGWLLATMDVSACGKHLSADELVAFERVHIEYKSARCVSQET
jgi:hypothetical protein